MRNNQSDPAPPLASPSTQHVSAKFTENAKPMSTVSRENLALAIIAR
jgi:hypothetical protein